MAKHTFEIEFAGIKASKSINIINNENNDLFIDNRLGKVLGHLGTGLGDIRLIKASEWDWAHDIEEIPTEKEKINYLIENSILVTVDDDQIQDEIQAIHSLTKNIEYQVFIILSRAGIVKAVRGPDGRDGETDVVSYNYNDDEFAQYPYVEVNGRPTILLGQVHTHNLMKTKDNKTGAQAKIYGQTNKNGFGPSKDDENTAASSNIIVYNIDSWNFSSSKAQATIGRVKPNENPESSIAKTIGGKGKEPKAHLNIGWEVLNYRISKYDAKLVRK